MGPLCQDPGSPDRLRWVGDPVDVVTGALAEVAGEFSIPGAPPIVWQRHDSTARAHLPMSLGWGQTHEYDRTLRMVVDGWLYTAPGGDEVLFVYGPDDTPIRSDRHYLTPRSGALELRTPRDEVLIFGALEYGQVGRPWRIRETGGDLLLDHDRDGRLVRIRDVDNTRVITLDHVGDRVTALCLVAHPQRPRSAPLALMRYRYDDRRDLVEAIDRYGHRQTFAYDDHHRVVARTDRSGYRFEYEYDRDGRCGVTRGHDDVQEHRLRYMPEAQATLVTKGDGGEWLYRYDEVGSITDIIDPQGGVRRFEYDADGTLRKETDPTGNTRVAVLGARRAIVGWTNDAGGYRSSGRPTGPHRHRVPRTPIELELGDLGGRVRRDAPIASPGIAPLFLHGASISTRLFRDRPSAVADRCRRDELGLLIEEQNPDAPRPRRWSYTPNGWVRRYTDHDGGTYDFQFTSWNHRCAATDPLGRTIRYEYTSDEKTSVVTDPAGNRHFHRRDLRGHITEIHCNGALFESYELDLAGNLLVKRDARGKVELRHEYGPDNLKSRRILADGEEHRYQYTRDGRYERIYFGEQMLDFAHSSGGRRKADLRDGHGVVHAFDGDRLRATRVLARFTTRYRHLDGGTVEVVDPTGRRHTLRLGERGEVVRELACGIREEQRYDSLGRRLGTALVNPEGRTAWRRDYHYSAEGDLVAVDESERGRTRYRHDAAHQLSEVLHPDDKVDAYRYDEAANLIGAPHLARVAVGPGNKLLVGNGGDVTHDDRDRMATWERDGQALRFHHDALDQLRRIDGLGAPWSAEYDPLGRRISKTFGGETTTYYWDTDRLAAEVGPSGALRLYVYTDDFALTPWLVIDYAGVDADPASGRLHYLVSDQRGAPVLALDADGEVAWSASIAPYGLASTEGELRMRLTQLIRLIARSQGWTRAGEERKRTRTPIAGRTTTVHQSIPRRWIPVRRAGTERTPRPTWSTHMVDHEPRQGSVDSLVERIQSYVARVDPAFPERCIPAGPDAIERYARLAEFGTRDRLPPSYRAFLEGMGREDGGLLRSRRVQASLDSILRLYDDSLRLQPESLNPELPLVATFLVGGEISLDLRVRSADPPVVETSEGDFTAVLSRSWEWFLMRAAMSWVVPRLYPYSWVYTGSANSMSKASPSRGGVPPEDVVRAFLTREGMTHAWPSEERHHILQSEDSVVFVDFHERGGVMIRSFSAREAFCRIKVRTMASPLGAESDGPSIVAD